MPTAQPLTGPLDFGATGVDAVLQNIGVILATREGSVPLDRGFGTSWDHVDLPRPLAEQQIRADVIDAIEEHEPRASVESVEFTANEAGRLVPKATVSIDRSRITSNPRWSKDTDRGVTAISGELNLDFQQKEHTLTITTLANGC